MTDRQPTTARPPAERVALMGLSGSGKSTIAALLGPLLRWEVVDTDALIVTQTGRQIHEIFTQDGEPAFRALERRAVATACAQPHRVIALGGGAPLDTESLTLLRSCAVLVWLRAAPETLVARLRAADNEVRPLLAGDALSRLRSLLAHRAPVYSQADLVIDTDTLTPADAARQIAAWIAASAAERARR